VPRDEISYSEAEKEKSVPLVSDNASYIPSDRRLIFPLGAWALVGVHREQWRTASRVFIFMTLRSKGAALPNVVTLVLACSYGGVVATTQIAKNKCT